MAKPLTVKAIEGLKPGAMRQEIADGLLPGLYFVIQPSGSKGWAVRYRYAGKTRKLTLGAYPALGLADARLSGGKALRAVAEGKDPASDKVAAKRQARVARAATDDLVPHVIADFLRRYVEPKNKSADETRRILEREVASRWKDRRIQEISRRDVVSLLDTIVDRGAPYVANRTFAALRRMMNWCVERSLVDTSPCANVKPPAAEISRDRVLTDDELRWFWRATGEIGGLFGPLFRLLLVTGQRREEVGAMSRKEIAGASDLWRVPKERAKNGKASDVPLSSLAQRILIDAPKVAGKADFVFTTTGVTPVSGFSRVKERLDQRMLEIAREEAVERGEDPADIELSDWRTHDLRRTAASGMARLGQPIHVVEAILNHTSGAIRGVAAVYNRYDYADEKRRALEAWAGFLERLVDDKETNVVELRAVS